MVLGMKIKQLRNSKDLTLEQLADKIGLKKQQIWNYENGKSNPPIEKVNLLADFFGVQPSDILNNNDESKITSDAWANELVNELRSEIADCKKREEKLMQMLQMAIAGKGNFLKGNNFVPALTREFVALRA
jgi:transcriptional regulator with XRE-family HTH domain